MIKLLEYLYVFELITFSGGIAFNGSYPRLALIVWFITSVALLLSKHDRVNPYNLRLMSLLIIWILLVQFVLVRDHSQNTFLSYVFYILGGGIGLSSFDFQKFKTILLTI